MSFRLVPKSVTLNDLERRNGAILRCFSEFEYLPGALRKSSRSLSHLLMSSCCTFDRVMFVHSFKLSAEKLVYDIQLLIISATLSCLLQLFF